jgi:hypothetical protein
MLPSRFSRSYVLPNEPFTIKIREILVRTKRAPRNALGAARHTTALDRVNGDIWAFGLRLCIVCTHKHANAKFTTNHLCQHDGFWSLFMSGAFSASAVVLPFLHQGIGKWSRRRLVPQKQARTFPGTLKVLSLPLWQLFQRKFRGATTDSARKSLTATR